MQAANPSSDPQQLDLLRVARVGRAQGLKGEVTVQSFTDEPEYRYEPGSELYTKDGSQVFVVEASRSFKQRWILKFEGIDDRNAAEALNGTVLYGEADDLDAMIEEDVWYAKDLVGLEVRLDEQCEMAFEAAKAAETAETAETTGEAAAETTVETADSVDNSRIVGKVVDVLDGPQWLLKVRLTRPVRDDDGVVIQNSALVPFVEQIVPVIDLDEQYLTIDPPGGLIPQLGQMDISEESN
ncbi:ribosome maturation factor RimM [Bifidobacterium dolichotidis]|nr:ribosome maturation factor RimM [Bifidobacterium dolichotidis]